MKTIGIKLADGSFYPILKTPGQKILDLTTAKDNQSTVQIDLYKSATDSMQDAEYVDTLRIKNFPPKASGQPTMNLSVCLDDNNVLSAHVIDRESGLRSDTQIELLTLTGQTQIQEPVVDNNSQADFKLPPLDSLDGFQNANVPTNEPQKETIDVSKIDPTDSMQDFPNLSDLPDFEEEATKDLAQGALQDKEEEAGFSASFLDTPDFDSPKENNLAGYLDDPVFQEPAFNDTDLSFNDDNDANNDSKNSQEKNVPDVAMDFSGLYDKETMQGNSALNEEDKKKCKKGLCVIICIICALICLVTTAILLLAVPSK